ncbi:MAG: CRISPR-associated endonuclease Cas1 [Gemmataceae bacterium]|nr:CRISPR-associated endonuclease Cas1 [Gemmataceae bacterium]
MRRITSVSTPIAHLVGPGSLKVSNDQLVFTPLGGKPMSLIPKTLNEIICYGEVSVSANALEILFQHGIQTVWMTPSGQKCRGRLYRADPPTTLLRVRQHRIFALPKARLAWSIQLILAKIDSMNEATRHYQRHGFSQAGPLMEQFAQLKWQAQQAQSVPQLLGIEGTATSLWFQLFRELILPPWSFPKRVRRPPTDPANALLSLGYTLLLNRVNARAEAKGFEIYLGALHEYRAGRPSLSCDLMEPMRVPVVDRWVLMVCNQQRLTPNDFEQSSDGGARLLKDRFGYTLRLWEEFWQSQRAETLLEYWLDELAKSLSRWSEKETDETSSSDEL